VGRQIFPSLSAARPEWYLLFLFQFLKLFPDAPKSGAAIIIPALGDGESIFYYALSRAAWRLGHRYQTSDSLALPALWQCLLTWAGLFDTINSCPP